MPLSCAFTDSPACRVTPDACCLLLNVCREEARREATQQQQKLNFLLTQSEIFAHFMGAKMGLQGTPGAAAAASGAGAGSSGAGAGSGSGSGSGSLALAQSCVSRSLLPVLLPRACRLMPHDLALQTAG